MARNTKTKFDAAPTESMEIGGTPIRGLDSIPDGEIPSDAPIMTASAPKSSTATVPPPDRFVVQKTFMVLLDGIRQQLSEGKIIDANNYDIAYLKRVGAKLQPVEE